MFRVVKMLLHRGREYVKPFVSAQLCERADKLNFFSSNLRPVNSGLNNGTVPVRMSGRVFVV